MPEEGTARLRDMIRLSEEANASPGRTIVRWKAMAGGKAIGIPDALLPCAVPAAAGMLPVRPDPWGASPPDREAGMSPPGPEIDAWAIPEREPGEAAAPLTGTRLPVYRMPLPPSAGSGVSLEPFLDVVEAFAEWAGQVAGRPVTEGALDRAIRSGNRRLQRLLAFERLLRERPGLLSATAYAAVALVGRWLPADAHFLLLGNLLREIDASSASTETGASARRTKVFIAGDPLFPEAARALDRAGAVVVGTDPPGAWGIYGEPTPEDGDPAIAIARVLRASLEAREAAAGNAGAEEAAALEEKARAAGAERILVVRGEGDMGAARTTMPALHLTPGRFRAMPAKEAGRLAAFLSGEGGTGWEGR